MNWPALTAFDCGDDFGLWLWTYRVWNGFRWPVMPARCVVVAK